MSGTVPLGRSVETHISIARPIEAVWAVLTDLAAYRHWNPYMIHVEGAPVAGGVIEVHTRSGDGGAARVQTVDVVSVTPFRMRWQGGAANRAEFMGDHFFDLVANGPNSTVLHHYEHFSGSRLIEFGAGHESLVRDNFGKFNNALKARCEALA